jgi:hypothetical protein
MEKINDYLYALYANILALPLIIQISIVFILSSIALVLIFFLAVALIRVRHNRQKRKENNLFPKIDNLIFKYFFAAKQDAEDFEIRNNFSDSIGKLTNEKLDLIIERLIVFKTNYRIEQNDNILRLMYVLNLEKHLTDKLQFSSTKKKIKALKELANLANSANESDILPFTYNRNKNIRLESRTAYLKLSKNDPFKFFDETKDDLSTWDQISLLNHIKNSENFTIPNFSRWISYSKNNSIVSFCLKMCAYFQQKESIPSIEQFLNTPDHNLRAIAIETLGNLNALETEQTLINLYPNQPSICQTEILTAIGKFKTGNHISFLENEFKNGSSVDSKKNAAYALLEHGERTNMFIADVKNDTNDFDKLILQHVENPNILFK